MINFSEIYAELRDIWSSRGKPGYIFSDCSPVCSSLPEQCEFPEESEKIIEIWPTIKSIDGLFIDNHKEHKLLSNEDIISYFLEIFDDNVLIAYLNGVYPGKSGIIRCDICRKETIKLHEKYFYCFGCCTNICEGCFGNSLKCGGCEDNYGNIYKIQKRENISARICDFCAKIIIPDRFYSVGCENYCGKCVKIDNISAEPGDYACPADYSGFGSILDYIPIISDSEDDYVLINVNLESEFYGKICLMSTDSEGSSGYHVTEYTLNYVFSEICRYTDDPGFQKLKKYDRVWNLPIKKMMKSGKIPVYFD